jgi:hypothetical protein
VTRDSHNNNNDDDDNNNNNPIIVYSCAESTARCPIIETAQHTRHKLIKDNKQEQYGTKINKKY